MNNLLLKVKEKVKNKEFIQDLLVNLIGDLTLLIIGLVLGYYVKCAFI